MFGLPSTAADARPLGAVSLLASLEALAVTPLVMALRKGGVLDVTVNTFSTKRPSGPAMRSRCAPLGADR